MLCVWITCHKALQAALASDFCTAGPASTSEAITRGGKQSQPLMAHISGKENTQSLLTVITTRMKGSGGEGASERRERERERERELWCFDSLEICHPGFHNLDDSHGYRNIYDKHF